MSGQVRVEALVMQPYYWGELWRWRLK